MVTALTADQRKLKDIIFFDFFLVDGQDGHPELCDFAMYGNLNDRSAGSFEVRAALDDILSFLRIA